MALIHCNFKSNLLNLETELLAILPEANIGSMKKYPVLYLLHGLSGNYKDWQRKTLIESYLKNKEIVIIMPNVHRSFYSDMKNGYKYFGFVSEELPTMAREFFPVSEKREDTYVAGLSMGGFGAMKLALNYPDRFSKAASLSGALGMLDNIRDVEEFVKNNEGIPLPENIPLELEEIKNIFGSYQEMKGSCNDLCYLINKNIADGNKIPDLYQCCGTEDFLYKDNINFRDYAKQKGLPITYEECSGEHTWDFWDKMIQNVIEWLDI